MNAKPVNAPIPDTSAILLFIKAPVLGRVKSRLAAAIGEKAALDLYENFVLDSLATVEKTGIPFRICVYPPEAEKEAASWLGDRYRFMPQEGIDLGERMESAFLACFSEGLERVVLMGSDLPDLPSAVLEAVISSLKQNDVAIGPASDGGYYLIGFNKDSFLPEIFHGIAWSTKTVFEKTMTVLRDSGLAIQQAPQWHDIDTLADLKALFERSKGTSFDKSKTMTYLRNEGARLLP